MKKEEEDNRSIMLLMVSFKSKSYDDLIFAENDTESASVD